MELNAIEVDDSTWHRLPTGAGDVLRGTKQRPDIREQSNLVAKEQGACKEEESIYGHSTMIGGNIP